MSYKDKQSNRGFVAFHPTKDVKQQRTHPDQTKTLCRIPSPIHQGMNKGVTSQNNEESWKGDFFSRSRSPRPERELVSRQSSPKNPSRAHLRLMKLRPVAPPLALLLSRRPRRGRRKGWSWGGGSGGHKPTIKTESQPSPFRPCFQYPNGPRVVDGGFLLFFLLEEEEEHNLSSEKKGAQSHLNQLILFYTPSYSYYST
jgi:hypothetical protein